MICLQRQAGRPIGESCRLGRAELVQAYELRQAGVTWGELARRFLISDRTLYRYFKRCEKFGLSWLKKP